MAMVAVIFAGSAVSAGDEAKPERLLKAPSPGTRAYSTMKKTYDALVAPVFAKKCMDCHSANTHYPWYYNMPLVKSLMDRDIRNARRLMDLTDGFPFTGIGTLADRLTGLNGVAKDNSMPPLSYKLAHLSSSLTRAERALIIAWTSSELPLSVTETGAAKNTK